MQASILHLPTLMVLLQATALDTILIVFTILVVVIGGLYVFANTPVVILGAWHHTFEKVDYSPQEIYALIEQELTVREVPGVTFDRVTRFQTSILGAQREYLRIKVDHYMVDVCAAPFAKNFFVSWRMMEQKTFMKEMMRKFPALESLADHKTFYEQDTEHMIKDYIHNSILHALGEMASTKGMRALSESERMLQRN